MKLFKISNIEIIEECRRFSTIVRGRDTPDFGHAFWNRTRFWTCGWFWLSSVQRARRVAGE